MGVFDVLGGLFGSGSGDEESRSGTREAASAGDLGPSVFRDLAAEFARREADADPDFTLDSLRALDDAAEDQHEALAVLDEEMDEGEALLTKLHGDYTIEGGSYFGEVLVREFDGQRAEDDGWAVAIPVADGVVEVAVFDVAAAAARGEPQFRAIVADLEGERVAAEDRAARSDAPAGQTAAEVSPADAADDDIGPAYFADQTEKLIDSWPDYALDYSTRSLARTDELVRKEFADYDFTEVELGDESDGDSLFLTAHAMDAGAYFSAVLERHLDAEWADDEDGLVLVVDGADAYAEVDPFAIAAKCFRGEGSFAASYEAIRAQLSIDAPPAEE